MVIFLVKNRLLIEFHKFPLDGIKCSLFARVRKDILNNIKSFSFFRLLKVNTDYKELKILTILNAYLNNTFFLQKTNFSVFLISKLNR